MSLGMCVIISRFILFILSFILVCMHFVVKASFDGSILFFVLLSKFYLFLKI